MTQEEKELLLKDLCGRLRCGVLCTVFDKKLGFFGEHAFKMDGITIEDEGIDIWLEKGNFSIETIKPYLRPMSSMTEEEKEELKQEHSKDEKLFAECLRNVANGDDSMRGKVIPHFAADWCNKNHFDYRGLIPMGLALEAPEGMYK